MRNGSGAPRVGVGSVVTSEGEWGDDVSGSHGLDVESVRAEPRDRGEGGKKPIASAEAGAAQSALDHSLRRADVL